MRADPDMSILKKNQHFSRLPFNNFKAKKTNCQLFLGEEGNGM
jgi:hypothetical protein